MDEDGLPLMGSGIDLTKVPAIQQKRTVAFLNQFVVHTVQFLNCFSTVCEEKLEDLSLRIHEWLWEVFLCVSLCTPHSLSPFSMTRTPPPLQHPGLISPPNHISALPIFLDVASSLPLAVHFVLSVLGLISWIFRII
uniref:WASH complex subunit 3 n=2 Tax=Canis lupus familiaris TaxID=9615 RepID=A0A8C0TDC5_CANLF